MINAARMLLSAAQNGAEQVNFNDIFSGGGTEALTGTQFDIRTAVVSLAVSVGLGLLICLIYKLTFSGVIYSATFNASLLLMALMTTVIIITISSNVVLSLGMVGALSIVRFRAAIKDPIDIMYLFWAITVGIVVGVQQYLFALIASVIAALVCIVVKYLRGGAETYLLVVRYSPAVAESMDKYISSLNARLRNKTAAADSVELTAEISRRNIPQGLVEKLSANPEIFSAVLVNFNGEYCD